MKVLYLISIKSHGRGGHVHSLNHITNALAKNIEIGICTIGTGKSHILESSPHFIKHIPFNGLSVFSTKKEIQNIISSFEPNIVHCFDIDVFNIFSLLFDTNKYKVILNKCGGPNPKEHPYAKNIILFSYENLMWFRKNKKFDNSLIELIPNRVNKSLLDLNYTNEKIIKKDDFCFVRISRIGDAYKESIKNSIELISTLIEKGVKNVHLYLIGVVENSQVFDELQELAKHKPVSFITENEYTSNASKMLYLADAVIATGRGIMEGTSLGIPILTPAANSSIPILVTEDNFETFFKTNFSQRNVADEKELLINLQNIIELIRNDDYRRELKQFSEKAYIDYFDVEGGENKYLDFYKVVLEQKKSKNMDISIYNRKYQLKALYNLYRKAKRQTNTVENSN